MLASIMSSGGGGLTVGNISNKKGSLWSQYLKNGGSATLSVASNVVETLEDITASRFNAAMADFEGQFAKKMSILDEDRFMDHVRRVVGTAVANAGASGFSLESESTQKAIDDIVRSGELDAALIRIRGDIGQWRSKTEEMQHKQAAKDSMVKGLLSIGNSIYDGMSDYGKMGGTGAFG